MKVKKPGEKSWSESAWNVTQQIGAGVTIALIVGRVAGGGGGSSGGDNGDGNANPGGQ